MTRARVTALSLLLATASCASNHGASADSAAQPPSCANPIVSVSNRGTSDVDIVAIVDNVNGGTREQWLGTTPQNDTRQYTLPISSHGVKVKQNGSIFAGSAEYNKTSVTTTYSCPAH